MKKNINVVIIAIVFLIFIYQNCSKKIIVNKVSEDQFSTDSKTPKPSPSLSCESQSLEKNSFAKFKIENSSSLRLYNNIEFLPNCVQNNSFKTMIQNIVIFQIGGWTELLIRPKQQPERELVWPSCGGKKAYVSRNRKMILRQFEILKRMNLNSAAAILMMPPDENTASGYTVCWNGITEDGLTCQGGSFKHPHELYSEILSLAEQKGVMILPHISIMGWGKLENNPEKILESLAFMTNKIIEASNNSKAALRDSSNRLLILLEGFATFSIKDDLVKEKFRKDGLAYLKSQDKVIWLDTLLDDPLKPESFPENVFHWSFGELGDLRWRRQVYGSKYSYHVALNKTSLNKKDWIQNRFSNEILMEQMGITPASEIFPVIISQFNEYAEYHIIEPSDLLGSEVLFLFHNYLSKQIGSHPDNQKDYLPVLCEDPFNITH